MLGQSGGSVPKLQVSGLRRLSTFSTNLALVAGAADDLAATGHKTCERQCRQQQGDAGQMESRTRVPSLGPQPEMQSDAGMKPDHQHGDESAAGSPVT